jgi:hypothetical protein
MRLPTTSICNPLFAIDAEIVHRCSHCSIGIDRDMESLVDQEIIPRPLADDAEIVYHRSVEREASYTRLKLNLVIPMPWYLSPVTEPVPLIPSG